MQEKNIRFNSTVTEVEKINPLFSRASIRALYVGCNRNGSHFSKEVVEDAIKTIYNVPIVGEYLEEKDNFGGHGGELVIKDDEISLKVTTMPYGVIPESATVRWEIIQEKDGTYNEYLIIDGAYLWSGRYEELNGLLENSYGQSMEIEVVNGNFGIVDGVETFKVDEFIFSAFCILGIDKNGEGHVEPAFESANIETYSLNKDEFKKEFNKMIAELKFSLTKGGEEMTEKIERDYEKTEVLHENKEEEKETEVNIAEDKSEATNEVEDDKSKDNAKALEASSDKSESTFEDEGDGETAPTNQDEGEEEVEPEPDTEPEEPEVDTSELGDLVNSSDYNSNDYTEESYGAYSEALATANNVLSNAGATQEDANDALQALQNAINGLESKPEEPEVKNDDDDNTSVAPNQPERKKIEDFALTATQLRDQLWSILGKEEYNDDWGNRCRKYWYVDNTDTHVIYEDTQDFYQLYSAEYTVEGDSVKIDKSTSFKVKVEYVKFEGESYGYANSFERFAGENESVSQQDYEVAQKELDELKEYKRQREESDLKFKFEGQLSEDEFKQVFSNLKESSIEDIEKELFALVGKKNFSLPKSNEQINKIPLEVNHNESNSENPYSALEIYIKK